MLQSNYNYNITIRNITELRNIYIVITFWLVLTIAVKPAGDLFNIYQEGKYVDIIAAYITLVSNADKLVLKQEKYVIKFKN